MQVVASSAGPPSGAARSALANMFRTVSHGIIGSSLVVPGVGFRMATARAIATGMIMLARLRFPHEVHSSVERGAAWHASLHSNGDAPFQTRNIVLTVHSLEGEVARMKPAGLQVANATKR